MTIVALFFEQGFTSGEADGIPGDPVAMPNLLLDGADWVAEWTEGTYVDGEVCTKPNELDRPLRGPKCRR